MNRFTSNFFALALALLVAVALIPMSAFGQAISGDLVGTVSDKSGALIPNATVTATNEGTNIKSTTTTNANGEYRFGNLLVGTYDISATAKGFSTTSVKGFVVQLNKVATADISLEVGQLATTVEVTAGTPPIDTTTATIETTYEQKALQDLPTAGVGLGVLNLSLLQSGVASSGGLGAGSGPSVGGQRPRNNNFTVEGVDNNDKGVTGPLIYVPNDAVSNFSVLQNQFSPEFGHSTGGQFNIVTISGTNTFHGRAYEYMQNRNLNAIDQSLANQGIFKNPRYDNNRFGGQLGGPIFKNKLFFFVNYERNPIGQAASPGSPLNAPTAAGYTTLLGIPTVSASNVNGLQQYAQAPAACSAADIANGACPGASVNQAGTQICPAGTLVVNDYTAFNGSTGAVPHCVEVGVLPLVAPNFSNFQALTTSIDYNISDKDQIRGRYIYNKNAFVDTGLTGVTLPIFYQTIATPYHLIAISEYHAFSPMVNNEFRVGYNRVGTTWTVPNLTFATLDAFPNMQIDDLGGLNIGPDPNAPQYSIQNLYQAVDNLTWIKGNHSFKFGAEGRKYISPQKFIQRSRGDYEWASSGGCAQAPPNDLGCSGGLDSFANDFIPDFAERSFGSVGYSGDQYAVYWFVNDSWKIRPNFTLNLGLRYEYTSTPFGWTQQSLNSVSDVPGLITFGSPQAPKKDFAPRVGFAWSPGSSGTTSFRGGIGMGYDVLYDNIGVLSRPPQIGSTNDCPSNCLTPFLANGGIPPQASSGITVLDADHARLSTSSFLPNQVKYPYSISWNLGVQHVFATNYTAEVRYVGTRGVDLNVQNRINIQSVVTPTNHLPTYLQAPDQATLDALPVTLDGPGGLFDQQLSGSTLTTPGSIGFMVPAYLNAGFGSLDPNNQACNDLQGGQPCFTEIVGFMPWGASTYHGLQAQLNRRFSNGLQFQAAYTWSHAIDNSTADFFSTVITPRRPQDFRNLQAERSSSALDHRHRFTVATIYDMPFFSKSSNWFKRNVLGNYEFAPVYTYETGEWGTVQSGIDSNLNTDSAGDRVVFNPAGKSGTGSDVTALTNTAGFTVAYVANDPNAQYIKAGFGALADTGRNTLRTPPINNWDVTLLKRIKVTERVSFEMMAGLFNAFNHPQFTTGSLNQINSIGRTSGAQRNYLEPNKPNFNNARETFPSNARTMQLGAKFIF